MTKKYEGAFLGCAVGDALGAAAQSRKPGRVSQLYGRLTGYVDFDEYFFGDPGKWRISGLYGAPAQIVLSVAESMLLSGGYRGEDVLETLRSMLSGDEKSGLFRAAGAQLKKTLERLNTGDPIDAASSYPGLEAACAALPPALHFPDDQEARLRAAVECALLFSGDPRSVGAAAAYASAAALLCEDSSPGDLEKAARVIMEETRRAEELLLSEYRGRLSMHASPETVYAMSRALELLPACLREDDAALAERSIVAEANRREPPFRISSVNQGFAPVSLSHILWLALKAESFSALMDAVAGGKEARLAGCLCGGLLGLRFGSESIPGDWIEGLKNAPDIRMRGAEFAQGYPDWSIRRDLVEMEREWTLKERKGRAERFDAMKKEKEKREKKSGKPTAKKTPSPRDRLPDQVDAEFAPSPGIVFDGELPDPIKAKKQKAVRGRKRIPWKEERRKKRRREKKDLED